MENVGGGKTAAGRSGSSRVGASGGGGEKEKSGCAEGRSRVPLPRKGAALLGRGGDWTCPSCEHLNFTGRLLCQSCNSPAPAPGAAPVQNKVRRLCVSHDGAATLAELTKWFSAYGPLAEKIVDRGTVSWFIVCVCVCV